MINLKKLIYISSLSIALPIAHAGAQTLAAWNFENDAQAVNNSPTSSTGTGTADSIGMDVYPTPNVGVTTDDVLAGVTGDTGVNGIADTGNIWRIRAQAGANGAANGWSSLAPIGTQGAQFFTSTAGVTSGAIQITFDWYSTNQGEANMQAEYTTDGGATWNNLALTLGGSDAGLTALTNSTSANTVKGAYVSGGSAGQNWYTGLTATINSPSVLNDAGFGIEMVNASTGADDVSMKGTALNNNSGNWRFDNVAIANVGAAPEPSTYALIGVSTLVLLVAVRRRSALLS